MQLNQRLIALAECWAAANDRSVARLATIVANDGGVFERLARGKNCTTAMADRFFVWFRDPANWPGDAIPAEAVDLLDAVDLGVVHTEADSPAGAPLSTVHSWRKNGLPPSRLEHLKLIASQEAVEVDWETGLPLETGDGCSANHGGGDTTETTSSSHGKTAEVSTPAVSA